MAELAENFEGFFLLGLCDAARCLDPIIPQVHWHRSVVCLDGLSKSLCFDNLCQIVVLDINVDTIGSNFQIVVGT